VKEFALYTLARLGLFAGAYGLIWLVFGHWIDWTALSALYTAIIAMVVSSLIAFATLKSLRENLAAHVERRATRAKEAFDARRSSEDDD
jgi:H+/Cl- antiporter ClcA